MLSNTSQAALTTHSAIVWQKGMKDLLQCTTDPYMNYRPTPLPWCNYSPAEMLMRRKVTTSDILQTTSQLTPQLHILSDFQQKDKDFKDN